MRASARGARPRVRARPRSRSRSAWAPTISARSKIAAIDTLFAIAKALGCSPAELLDDAHSKDPWVDEVLTVAATVPKGRRELALAVLKTMATAAE
nr:hypothetical protein [Deltaproteobacteria bacterium]